MAKKYIDADKLKALIDETMKPGDLFNPIDFKSAIYMVDAEDVAPVIHAEWKNNGANYKCSNCGNTEPYYDMLYCPKCGAKMDAESE